MSAPRIVILCGIGFVVRNYLSGGFIDRLAGNADLTVLSPLAHDADFVATLARRSIRVESLGKTEITPAWRRTRILRDLLHSAKLNTETFRMKLFDPQHHSETPMQRLKNRTLFTTARLITNERALRRLDAQEAEHAMGTDAARTYGRLFEEIKPDLVFSAAPLLQDEWVPVQVARSMGIPTALSILSWDNLSSKLRLPVPNSAYLVWSQHMRDELLRYYPTISPETVRVTGAPQFDFYQAPEYQESREQFFTRIGGDPSRPLIVYAGVTPGLMPYEQHIVENFVNAVKDGRIERNPQLMIRLHPKDDGSRYKELRSRYPDVMFEVPGERSGGSLVDWKPDSADIRELVSTMRHGDVHINVCSTMTIDAAIVDRPVINIRYDLRPENTPPSWGVRGYEYTHYRPLLKTGGVRLVDSPEELITGVNAYLSNPALDRDGRRRIVELECGDADGHAGKRAAEALLSVA